MSDSEEVHIIRTNRAIFYTLELIKRRDTELERNKDLIDCIDKKYRENFDIISNYTNITPKERQVKLDNLLKESQKLYQDTKK